MVVISCIHLDKLPIPVPIHDMFDTYHVEFLTTHQVLCLIKQIFHLFSQQFVTGQTVHQYGELDPIQFVVHHFTTSNYLLALENQKVLIIDNTKSYGASIQLLPIPVIGRTVSRSAAIATPKYQQPCGPGPAEKMPTKWPFLQNCISSSHCTWDGCAALQEIRTHKIHAQCNTNHIQN